MIIAMTRPVCSNIVDCELTYLIRQPIEVAKAARQQQAYERKLADLGVRVCSLQSEPHLPDSTFIQDTAVVVDELAVIARMGARKRRKEVESAAKALSSYRHLRYINHSATLEGGDVIRIGRSLYVGISSRTSRDGCAQLRSFLEPFGYSVFPVEVKDCLHLTTACSFLGKQTVLVNPAWVDTSQLEGLKKVAVPTEEPWAANAVLIRETILMSCSYPRTYALLQEHGFEVETIDISELEKAEAGLSCLSIIFEGE